MLPYYCPDCPECIFIQKKHMRPHTILNHNDATQKTQALPKPNNWLLDIIEKVNNNAIEQRQITTRARNDSLCVLCKGARAPLRQNPLPNHGQSQLFPQKRAADGNRRHRRHVSAQRFHRKNRLPKRLRWTLVPPVHEDTSIYDLPEQWFGKSMDEIVGFRSLLVRGKHRVNVQKFMDGGKIMDQTRELALADNSVDMELEPHEETPRLHIPG